MSVYIRDMSMPQNCYGCPFFAQYDYWNRNDEADTLSQCKRTGERTWDSVIGYLPNCPLISVPYHRRLIDADALASMYDPNTDFGKSVRDTIKDCPTIIPEDTEEQT